MNKNTLAGGLSNTIAGRICNCLNLDGGGYTVDGACSSSLLPISTAASRLCTGDLDIALAGGVDNGLDPFEMVGFRLTEEALKLNWTRDVFDRWLLAEAKILRQGFISAGKNIQPNWR